MDTGLNVRPVQTSSAPAVRVDVAPQRQAVRAELPETQVVLAVSEPQPVQFEQADQQQKLRAELNRVIDAVAARPTVKVTTDEATKELVFFKVSPSTGRIIQQFPDEAVMRQRAYAAQQRREALEQALEFTPEPIEERVVRVA
jgi:uncharacterized FlaG/YvyC family protein